MSARILDGKGLAATICDELSPRIDDFLRSGGRPPQLGILLVGDHLASEVYVRNKRRMAEELGLAVDLVHLPATASLDDAKRTINRFNESESHDGILVQVPVPTVWGSGASRGLFEQIHPAKDVDSFHSINMGRLMQNRATLMPCTPSGIIELLLRSEIAIEGQHAVVLGRSEIVGRPLAMMLLHRHATVTICHSRTPNLASIAATADLLIVAVGRPVFVTHEFVKPGATVIDVGINRITDPDLVSTLIAADSVRSKAFERRGSMLVGDVHPDVQKVAGALTPVPGGVGPLTVAMLMVNTVEAATARLFSKTS